MANATNFGFEHRFAFGDSPHTFSGSSLRLDVVSNSVTRKLETIEAMGLLGSRTRHTDRIRAGLIRAEGDIVFEPTMRMWDYFLPKILGAAESTDTFDVAATLSAFDMLHDPFGTGSNAVKFGELYVNRASLKFAPGLLRLTLSVIGKTATAGQSFTSGSLNATADLDTPLMFYDTASGITLRNGSGTVEIDEGELIVDNQLAVKFRNSQTATSITPQQRLVTLATTLPLTATNWTTYGNVTTAADASIVITAGAVSSTITLFNLQHPEDGWNVAGKDEVPLILQSTARGDATDPDIRVTVVGGGL
jgi:hypothetical protein